MLASLEVSLQQAADALGHGGHGGGASQGGGGHSQLDADAANAAMQTLLAGMEFAADGSSGGGAGAAGTQGGASASAGAGQGRRGESGAVLDALQRGAPTMLLWCGRVAAILVQRTQLLRLLTAAAVAYAAASGLLAESWGGRGAPPHPAVVLAATQLSVLAAAVLIFGRGAARCVAETDGQGLVGGGGGGAQLPARLRQFDVLSYMPGAREALAGLSGYRQLINGFSEDVAAYLLVCGLLALTAA